MVTAKPTRTATMPDEENAQPVDPELTEPVAEEEEDQVDDLDDVADISPTSEVFEGGPTYGQVDSWKKEHGDVYVTSFGPDNHVVWRTLTRFEYRRLIKNLEMAVSSGQVTQAEANLNNEELVVELCLLHPKTTRSELSTEMAGLATIISQEVMEASGFVALDVRQL